MSARSQWQWQKMPPCRSCGAGSAGRCVTSSGAPSPVPHKARCEDAGLSLDYARKNANRAVRRAQDRGRVLGYYGEACACCGSVDDLTIDHVNGGGGEHRVSLGMRDTGGHQFYRWLIRNNFPPGFQTLCSPCNVSKGSGDRCRLHAPGILGILVDSDGKRIPVRLDSAEAVAKTLRKYMPAGQRALLRELLGPARRV